MFDLRVLYSTQCYTFVDSYLPKIVGFYLPKTDDAKLPFTITTIGARTSTVWVAIIPSPSIAPAPITATMALPTA